ncbi:hypothetical protein TRVL_07895 [Trypanosoma vivax]|nr:hypothetical protein TRVL_07895 [Trypanosoma vivax]
MGTLFCFLRCNNFRAGSPRRHLRQLTELTDECPGTRSDSSNCTTSSKCRLRITLREMETITCCHTKLCFFRSRSTASSRANSFVPLTRARTNAHAAARRSRELCVSRLANVTVAIGSVETPVLLASLSNTLSMLVPVFITNNTVIDTQSCSFCLLLISRHNCASTPSMPRIVPRLFRHFCQKLFFQCRVNKPLCMTPPQLHHICQSTANRRPLTTLRSSWSTSLCFCG